MDDYGKSSIGNQLCIDLVTTTSPSTSSSASSITSSPTSPISQESPSLCNVRFHREHSEASIVINNNNNNNNTPMSQNANLTNSTQEMIKQPIINSSNKKAYTVSTTHPQRHYSTTSNHVKKKSKKPTIDTKRTTVTPSTNLSSPYQPPPPIRYNNVYRFYNGGGNNNNKSADFASYDDPDRIIPTDELALFMRNKRRYCPPNFKPIPPSPGGWTEVVPDRTIAWELTCENHTDVSPFLRIRSLDGPLEMPWKSTVTTTTTSPTSSWTLPSFQARHRQQQQQRRDDLRPLRHRSLENVTTSTSSSDASVQHLLSPQAPAPASHHSHYSLPPTSSSSSSSLTLSQQCQVYTTPLQCIQQDGLGNNSKDEPMLLPTKNKKNLLSPLDTTFTQLLDPSTMTYSAFQSPISHDSIQELPTQAVQVDTASQRSGWDLQQQQQRQDPQPYLYTYSTPSSTVRQQRTSFELLSPPLIDPSEHPARNNIGRAGSSSSLFSPWGNTSPPSSWLHDASPLDDATSQQQRYSSSFTREYDPSTPTSSYYRTRSSSLNIVQSQRRSLPQKDDAPTAPLWNFRPLLSSTHAAPPTESTSSSTSPLAWPLLQHQQQQHYHSYRPQQHHQQRPPTPDEIQDQRGKRLSTSDIQAWQQHYYQQQQQLQQQLQLSDARQPQQQQQQQQQREMDDRSISILRVLDTDNDHSTGHYSLFSKPVVTSNKKEQPSGNSAASTNHPLHHHHRLYYNISDYVVVSDA